MKIQLSCHLNGKLLFSLWEEWILLHSSQSAIMVVDDRNVCLWKWSGQCLWHDNIQYGSGFRSDLGQGLMKLRSLFSPLGILLSCEIMMKSSNGNMFLVTGPLCGEFAGRQWIPLTKSSDAEHWCFLSSAPEQRLGTQHRRRWLETPSCSLWRLCNVTR